MAEKKHQTTPMNIDRITELITAMERNAYLVYKSYSEMYGENDPTTQRALGRWLALIDTEYLFTADGFMEKMCDIFLEEVTTDA